MTACCCRKPDKNGRHYAEFGFILFFLAPTERHRTFGICRTCILHWQQIAHWKYFDKAWFSHAVINSTCFCCYYSAENNINTTKIEINAVMRTRIVNINSIWGQNYFFRFLQELICHSKKRQIVTIIRFIAATTRVCFVVWWLWLYFNKPGFMSVTSWCLSTHESNSSG